MRWLAGELVVSIGARLGISVHLEPRYGYVGQLIMPDGRRLYFRNTAFDLNGQGASEVAKDKDYAAYFMQTMGYPTPRGATFFSDAWCNAIGSDQNLDAGYRYAKALGFPVIVKPNSRSQGSGVAKVFNKKEFVRAMRAVFERSKDRVALVQEVIPGDDYRIVVLDDRVISAYRRLPLAVTGDGASTIRELLIQKQAQFRGEGRETRIKLDDYRIAMRLSRLGMGMQSVPGSGEILRVLDNANLSSGGVAIDVSDVTHPGYQSMAITLSRNMGLRYSGVDIITADPIESPPGSYTILEINAAPGLDHYAETGERQRKIVEAMYEQILRAMAGMEGR